MGVTISKVEGLEGIDSRPNPNTMARVTLSDGTVAYAMSPSGASTGEKEQHEKRDGDAERYGGKGVLCTVEAIEKMVAPALIGMSPFDLAEVDEVMCSLDTSGNLSQIGANTTTAVSYAVAKAAASSRGQELFEFLGGPTACRLPVPHCKFMDGGLHARNGLRIQEFMWVPVGAPTFAEAVRWLVETFHALREILHEDGHPTTLGDEGGFAPQLMSNEEALVYGMRAIEKTGRKPGEHMCLSLDPAASAFFKDGQYQVEPTGDPLAGEALVNYWVALVDKFPIISIEDGVAENDKPTWIRMFARLGHRIQLVGDDIFCTNPDLLAKSLPPNPRFANSMLDKTNQWGTVTRALRAGQLAMQHGMTVVVSQRSGDTEFGHYADIAVAGGFSGIKPGSVARSDRGAKYNRLLWIEHLLGNRAVYPGWKAFTSVPALYAKGVN